MREHDAFIFHRGRAYDDSGDHDGDDGDDGDYDDGDDGHHGWGARAGKWPENPSPPNMEP